MSTAQFGRGRRGIANRYDDYVPAFIRTALINPRIDVDRTVFPFTLPVFKGFKSLEMHPQVTFLVGDNGSGKSTLLEAVAVAYGFPAEGGSKAHNFATFDSHSELHDKLLLAKEDFPKDCLFLRAETYYNFTTYAFQAWKESGGGPPKFGLVHERSHGEGFLDTIAKLKPPGLYLMDEPESALSATGQLTFLVHMKRLIDGGSQFIIATHSPILLGFGKSWIYEFTEDGMERTTYHKTKPYILTLDFLKNRGRYVKELGLDESLS